MATNSLTAAGLTVQQQPYKPAIIRHSNLDSATGQGDLAIPCAPPSFAARRPYPRLNISWREAQDVAVRLFQ